MSRFERLDGEKISKEAQKKSEWQATNPLRRSVERKGCAFAAMRSRALAPLGI